MVIFKKVLQLVFLFFVPMVFANTPARIDLNIDVDSSLDEFIQGAPIPIKDLDRNPSSKIFFCIT